MQHVQGEHTTTCRFYARSMKWTKGEITERRYQLILHRHSPSNLFYLSTLYLYSNPTLYLSGTLSIQYFYRHYRYHRLYICIRSMCVCVQLMIPFHMKFNDFIGHLIISFSHAQVQQDEANVTSTYLRVTTSLE